MDQIQAAGANGTSLKLSKLKVLQTVSNDLESQDLDDRNKVSVPFHYNVGEPFKNYVRLDGEGSCSRMFYKNIRQICASIKLYLILICI